jgi:hypothetical protein
VKHDQLVEFDIRGCGDFLAPWHEYKNPLIKKHLSQIVVFNSLSLTSHLMSSTVFLFKKKKNKTIIVALITFILICKKIGALRT